MSGIDTDGTTGRGGDQLWADPWAQPPMHYMADRGEAIREEVLYQTEVGVLRAGGFDAVRADPNHELHDVYDDLHALERKYEAIVDRVTTELRDDHFDHNEHRGYRLTSDATTVVSVQADAVRGVKPILDYRDDPNFQRDNPDELAPHHPREIDPDPTLETPAQALRMSVLHHLAPDIAGAGGFPGVDRNPNHRRHNSPAGLARVRGQYDAIVARLEPRLADTSFRLSDEYGWSVTWDVDQEVVKPAVERMREEQRWLDAHITRADPEQSHVRDSGIEL